MLKTRLALLAMTAAFTLPAAAPVLAQQASAAGFAQSDATDPYLWLEEVEGERAMAWVKQQNDASLGTLQGDPRYQGLHDQALAILNGNRDLLEDIAQRILEKEVIEGDELKELLERSVRPEAVPA